MNPKLSVFAVVISCVLMTTACMNVEAETPAAQQTLSRSTASPVFIDATAANTMNVETEIPMPQQTPSAEENKASTTSDDVTLVTEVNLKEDNLIIDYSLQNGLDDPIYLVNRIYKWTRSGLSVDSNLIYTELSSGTLRLIKANIDIPEHIDVESPQVPYLTLVEARSQFTETISLPLPLQPFHPYGQAQFSDAIQTFPRFEFILGWLPGTDITVNTVTPAGLTLLSAKYQDVVKNQRLLTSTFEIEIPTQIQKTE